MTTKKVRKFEKTKKIVAVSAFAGLSLLFVQKVYAQNSKEKKCCSCSYKRKRLYRISKKMMAMYKDRIEKREETKRI